MHQKAFAKDYVGLKTDGAQWLVDNTDIKLIGKTNTIFSTFLLGAKARAWKHGAHPTNCKSFILHGPPFSTIKKGEKKR